MPDLGCDEAVPRLLSHGRRARLGDGAHGPLHCLRVDRMRRDLHRSVHDVQQLGITEVPHERRLAERFSSAYYKSIISPAYQFRVDRGVEVDGGDGENPAAVLRLLLARGADQPHRPLADRAVPVGDHSQEKLLRVGPEAVPPSLGITCRRSEARRVFSRPSPQTRQGQRPELLPVAGDRDWQ